MSQLTWLSFPAGQDYPKAEIFKVWNLRAVCFIRKFFSILHWSVLWYAALSGAT